MTLYRDTAAPSAVPPSPPLAPSRYELPQHADADRRRARRATILQRRQVWQFATDELVGNPGPGFRLPRFAKTLPPEARFSVRKLSRLLAHKVVGKVNFNVVRVLGPTRYDVIAAYEELFRLFPGPDDVISTWRSNEEFARQRVAGVNPMSLTRCRTLPDEALVAAAAHALGVGAEAIAEQVATGRVYMVDHSEVDDPRVQDDVRRNNRILAAPTALFHVDDRGRLMPLAIRLRPAASAGPNPVFTPRHADWDWLAARTHFQAADAHWHEGVAHLLETHLVVETFAVAAARTLHPAHPLAQLFASHFVFNLAINALARRDLLGPTGPIQVSMAAGVPGVLDLGRMAWQRWDFQKKTIREDLRTRGVEDASLLPDYPYREHGLALHDMLTDYVHDVLAAWYRDDRDVREDDELQDFAREAADPERGGVPGFPEKIGDFATLVALATDVIFRATAQHAAVNNGQFDAYGFIPNAPGAFDLPLPTTDAPGVDEAAFVKALPDLDRTAAQVVMTWVLSEPTQRNLLHTGDQPAFAPEVNPSAARAVDVFRQRVNLRIEALHAAVVAHEAGFGDAPYVYLDPRNIARSIAT